MGIMLSMVAIIVIAAVCIFGGLTTFSIVSAILGVIMAGLASGIAGILILTNVFKMNYETALNRSFISGAALAAVVILLWTAVLDVSAGGLTVALVPNLWYVAIRVAATSFGLAVATMVTWGVLVFGSRKSKG
jgi:hypothetical protein